MVQKLDKFMFKHLFASQDLTCTLYTSITTVYGTLHDNTSVVSLVQILFDPLFDARS